VAGPGRTQWPAGLGRRPVPAPADGRLPAGHLPLVLRGRAPAVVEPGSAPGLRYRRHPPVLALPPRPAPLLLGSTGRHLLRAGDPGLRPGAASGPGRLLYHSG